MCLHRTKELKADDETPEGILSSWRTQSTLGPVMSVVLHLTAWLIKLKLKIKNENEHKIEVIFRSRSGPKGSDKKMQFEYNNYFDDGQQSTKHPSYKPWLRKLHCLRSNAG